MIKVGITGGLGSGKSTVCKLFSLLGVPVYYSDEESKNILESDVVVKAAVVREFGEGVLDLNGAIDRKLLAGIVFSDKNKLAKLNAITHPAVASHFAAWAELHKNSPYILKEAAILFESGADKQVDKVILVTAPQDLRIRRAMKRNRITAELALLRINNQLSDSDKASRSHYIIVNDEQEMLIPQVLKTHTYLV
ncbi:MAG: dephospho-CoA kinase [Bacteroidota bacterium]|nr:dephospho-CoA kinase [Bacteroidota bacterium]